MMFEGVLREQCYKRVTVAATVVVPFLLNEVTKKSAALTLYAEYSVKLKKVFYFYFQLHPMSCI